MIDGHRGFYVYYRLCLGNEWFVTSCISYLSLFAPNSRPNEPRMPLCTFGKGSIANHVCVTFLHLRSGGTSDFNLSLFVNVNRFNYHHQLINV